jgi:ribosomal protein S27E
MSGVSCQRCGAALPMASKQAALIACEYCGAMMAVVGGVLTVVGQRAKLAPPRSMFALGARFAVAGAPFRCVGRARYAYDDGSWDEWDLLGDDGRVLRVQDDEGDYVLFEAATFASRAGAAPSRPLPGSRYVRDGHTILVGEIGTARLEGAAGTLLGAAFTDDAPFAYVDGHASGRFVSVRDGDAATQWLWGRPLGRQEIGAMP